MRGSAGRSFRGSTNGDLGRRARHVAVLGLDREPRARSGQVDRHPDVADVPLEAGRPDRVGDAPDEPPVVMRRPRHGDAREGLARLELDADELAVDALPAEPLERLLADVVLRLLLDQPLEARDVKRRVGEREVGAAVEDAGLDAAGLVRRDRPDRELLAGGHDRVPHVVAA